MCRIPSPSGKVVQNESEQNLQPDLHLAWKVVLRRDHAEQRGAKAGSRGGELRMVHQIERLAAEHHGSPFANAKTLEQGEVQIPSLPARRFEATRPIVPKVKFAGCEN